eukprot:c26651_g1_i1 orf=256-2565(+)
MGESQGDSDHMRRQGSTGSSSKSGELSATSNSDNLGIVYQGVVFHVGVNSVGHQFCHLRYLRVRGKYVEMFKRDPMAHPSEKPIRRGVVGQFLVVEELGRQKVNDMDLYVLKISSRVDDKRMGQIACITAEDARNWKAAFQQAKEEAEADLRVGSGHRLIDETNEFKLDGHRPRIRQYARGWSKLITIGTGPEGLLRRESRVKHEDMSDGYIQEQDGDTVEQHEWRCVYKVDGIRILEDLSTYKVDKIVMMKSMGVIDATPSAVFEMLINVNDVHRKEWDILTGDLELVERVHGHLDVVYGTFDPKYFQRWQSKRDFVYSRYWRHDLDGSYSIIQVETSHKECPPKSGYHRYKINPSSWEIRPLKPTNGVGSLRSLVTQTMELRSIGWGPWKKRYYSKFNESLSFMFLCQIAGLRDFFAANPELAHEALMTTLPKEVDRPSGRSLDVVDSREAAEEFYDAIAAEVPGEEDEDSDSEEKKPKVKVRKLKNIVWSLMLGISAKRRPALEENGELMLSAQPTEINITHFKGTLSPAVGNKGSNCWADPGGKGFMVRGKTYLKDNLKVPASDPLLKLLAVDWFVSEKKVGLVAAHPKCLVQSEAGKELPFILCINLQVPANPNYNLVLYFGAERPIRKGSLLDKFANGDDMFRDAHFKLIPSIVEGYWVVKRAVGTKACLLGRAVNCSYHRQGNFLEIDVDISSSSVAKSVTSFVFGYVASIVVDLAFLIEGKDEHELPEYLLGTARINRIRLESAVPFWTEPDTDTVSKGES